MVTLGRVQLYKEGCAPLPDIFRGPHTSSLTYQVFPDLDSACAALRAGDVDLLDRPMPAGETLPPNLSSHPVRVFGYSYVGINTASNPTQWQEMRIALAYLFDAVKREMVAGLLAGHVEVMTGPVAELYGRVRNPYVRTYESTDADSALAAAVDVLRDFVLTDSACRDPLGTAIPAGAIRCLVHPAADDVVGHDIMRRFEALVGREPRLARLFTFESCPRNAVAARVFSREPGEPWHLFIGFNHIQDNLSRWNPGQNKTRYATDWLADYQSDNSETRNFAGLANDTYDAYAREFLRAMSPYDLRPASVTPDHLDPTWNNAAFWANGGDVPLDSSALLLAWKLQRLISEQLPIIPMIMPAVEFATGADVQGVWNGFPDESISYPGGIASYWTFQRIRRSGGGPVRLGITSPLRHINPLAAGSYQDSVIWLRMYDSLLSLNPFLLLREIAEDTLALAQSYTNELVDEGPVRQRVRYYLREERIWHDGEPFTTDDVAFTFLSLLGARGREIAARHPSTSHLIDALANDQPIPAWIDLVKSLHHIEIRDAHTIEISLTERSRYVHEWFGDAPILPMHVWRHLGNDFTRPVYRGVEGLAGIQDDSRIAPRDGLSGWNGLVGIGAFRWVSAADGGTRDPLTEGGRLEAFTAYHHAR